MSFHVINRLHFCSRYLWAGPELFSFFHRQYPDFPRDCQSHWPDFLPLSKELAKNPGWASPTLFPRNLNQKWVLKNWNWLKFISPSTVLQLLGLPVSSHPQKFSSYFLIQWLSSAAYKSLASLIFWQTDQNTRLSVLFITQVEIPQCNQYMVILWTKKISLWFLFCFIFT